MTKQPEPAQPEPVQTARDERPRLYSLVVIGASAGGIEAISQVLSALPADFPVPVVVAQHLDPRYPSRLTEILARSSHLSIRTATDQESLEPGVVYVAPEGQNVKVEGLRVRVLPGENMRPTPSINLLLSSASKVYNEHLIAVILSGTGTDGAASAREVKAADGTVIIENPATAAYPGMPASLAPTTVDLVVDLERIGPLLQELVSGISVSHLAHGPSPAVETAAELEDANRQRAFQTILTQLRERSGIDFTQYKRPTILRRLQRRMAVVNVDDLIDYLRYLDEHPSEFQLLASSFLIKVTEFFRDSEIFAALRDRVLPELIARARKSGNVLRIWSAGCATGEEAYSLAILVAEALGEEREQFNVQIFATDVDADAIAFARRGIYPFEALAEMPETLRARYFSKLDGEYEVVKPLRGLVVFGLHDLGRQAPFPHIDLVLCRNVLIYFTSELQRRALQLFAFALHSGGYLALGKAETIHPMEGYFAPADGQLKLYRREGELLLAPVAQIVDLAELPPPIAKVALQARRRPSDRHGVQGPGQAFGAGAAPTQPFPRSARGTEEWLGSLVMGLPLGVVVVDRRYDIQAINSLALRLLGIYTAPLGEDLIHLTQTIPTTALRTAIDAALTPETAGAVGAEAAAVKVVGGYTPAEAVVTVETVLGERRHLRISCYPYVPYVPLVEEQIPTSDTAQTLRAGRETVARPVEGALALLLIEDVSAQVEAQQKVTAEAEAARGEQEARATHERGERAHSLELIETENAQLKQESARVTAINRSLLEANQKLTETVLQLRQANDELVIDHEEAQANAEEVRTLNEELQSTNEEYVTVNEELEATVEELHVANDELQARTNELQRSAETLGVQRIATEAARARLEAILLSLGDAVLVVDQAGTPQLTNAAYATMFGGANAVFEAADQAGNPLPAEATPQQRAARGETFAMEFTLPGADGSRRYFEANGRLIRSADGTGEAGGVLAIRDVTESTLHRRLQDEFVGLASHELRTPLTPLTLALDMLSRQFADQPEDTPARVYTAHAKHQTQRLQRITQDLLDVNRLQTGKFDLVLEPVRFDEVVAEAVEAAQTMTDDQIIHLECADSPLVINGDALRLEQALTNLLTNAIIYAPHSKQIDVRVRRVGNDVEAQVQDYGPGIPAVDQPHIFSRFYQVVRTDAERPSRRGLGLGLYIAREVVTAHGGRIEVASIEAPQKGHGTTFIIRLPLARQETADHPTE